MHYIKVQRCVEVPAAAHLDKLRPVDAADKLDLVTEVAEVRVTIIAAVRVHLYLPGYHGDQRQRRQPQLPEVRRQLLLLALLRDATTGLC